MSILTFKSKPSSPLRCFDENCKNRMTENLHMQNVRMKMMMFSMTVLNRLTYFEIAVAPRKSYSIHYFPRKEIPGFVCVVVVALYS